MSGKAEPSANSGVQHAAARGRLARLAELDRPTLTFAFDGTEITALAGDTVLTAILSVRPALRRAEFGPESRAGFCLMGACQNCWVWQEDGPHLRACSTPVTEGMRLRSTSPECWPALPEGPQ